MLSPEDAARRLRGMAALLLDFRPFWPSVVRLFRAWMRDQFASEGGWGGHPWAPLSPAYAAWKAVHHPGRGILVLSGTMRNRATAPVVTVAPLDLMLTVKSEYAGYHQAGTRYMPARPLIPDTIPAAAMYEVEQAADRYVDEIKARWGL